MQVLLSLFISLVSAADNKPTRNLIITYGPPASGKSVGYEMWRRGWEKPEARKLDINVYDLVASNLQYQLVAKELLEDVPDVLRNAQLAETCYANGDGCEEFWEAEKEFCESGWQNYSSYRQQANILSNSMLLEQAVIKGKVRNKEIQDVVYEVSGTDESYEWMLKVAELAKIADMKVHLVYPIVSLKNLNKRALSRALTTGFLPCSEVISSMYEEAASNFVSLLINEDENIHFDTILVLDNDADGLENAEQIIKYDRSLGQPIAVDATLSVLQAMREEGKWPQDVYDGNDE